MYIHLGSDVTVHKKDIVGIFDIEKITVFKVNREYLSINEKSGKIINTTSELPKSFIVCEKGGQKHVYISKLLPRTIFKRGNP